MPVILTPRRSSLVSAFIDYSGLRGLMLYPSEIVERSDMGGQTRQVRWLIHQETLRV